MNEEDVDIELVVRDTARRMWSDFVARMDVQPSNKASFIAAVLPEIRKAFNERTSREGGHATSLVDQPQAVGGQLEPSVPYSAPPLPGEDTWGRIPSKPACEWGGGVCR